MRKRLEAVGAAEGVAVGGLSGDGGVDGSVGQVMVSDEPVSSLGVAIAGDG